VAKTAPQAAADDVGSALSIKLPEVTVTDQHGKQRRFVADLVKGRSVAINFIFTSCTSICTPLGATFKGMQDELARRGGGKDVHLISVSVDPLNDTPEELTKYARKFDAAPGWTLVTGSRKSIDAILRAFGVASGADPNDHSPMVFLGHEPSGRWTRAYGLGEPAVLTRRLMGLATSAAGASQPSTSAPTAKAANGTVPADDLAPLRKLAAGQAAGASVQNAASASSGASYFTNLPLVSQDRPRLRFYDDLVRGKVVLINSFYASCADVCSPVSFNLAQAQKLLDEQLDTPVQIVSISTDPVSDTPELLREYATRHGARPGWSFVTGKKENVDWVLHKLGLYNEDKTQHSAILWIGNDRSGAWLKLHALAPPEAIVAAVRKIL
jgi:cytochrome oxidase Cu insertion factor (SCO1/SenC/PrrC family)